MRSNLCNPETALLSTSNIILQLNIKKVRLVLGLTWVRAGLFHRSVISLRFSGRSSSWSAWVASSRLRQNGSSHTGLALQRQTALHTPSRKCKGHVRCYKNHSIYEISVYGLKSSNSRSPALSEKDLMRRLTPLLCPYAKYEAKLNNTLCFNG